MSVLASLRGESPMEFLDTARKLEIFTIRQTVKMPKRYTEYIQKDLVDMAKTIYMNVQEANGLFPKTKADVKIFTRRESLIFEALTLCRKMAGQLDIVWDLVVHTDADRESYASAWGTFEEYLSTEIRCLEGLKASDERKYASLKD